MNDSKFQPLTTTLTRNVLAWATLCMLVFAGLQGWMTYRTVHDRYVSSLQVLGVGLAKSLSETIWNLEIGIGQAQIDAAMANPYVGYAEANGGGEVRSYSKSGEVEEVRFAGGKPWFTAGNPALKNTSTHFDFDIESHRPHSDEGATLKLVLNAPALRSEVLESVAWVLVQCLALTGLILGVVLASLNRSLQAPLKHLAQFVGGLKAEEVRTELNLQRRKPSRQRDEIDLVVDGFQILQRRIGHHIETLDEQVADRTAQLQKSLDTLKTLSTTDPLTGCFNRLYFTQRFPEELSRAQRYQHALSTIYCDVDRFKSVNDSHGHGCGDQVLAAVGRCLRESMRAGGDWVVRFGGEEFVIVLPETNLIQALETAERMRQCIEQQVRVALEGGHELRVTLSFGVAEQHHGETGEALLERADRWLFAAKNGGRNQVQPLITEAALVSPSP